MNTTGGEGRSGWRESRRQRGWELYQQGWKQRQIAEALGVTQAAVSQWCKRARAAGVEGLRRRPPPGPAPLLSAAQRAEIPALLGRGPGAFGYTDNRWTTARIAQVLEGRFGVRYHRAHVSRLLRQVGWSLAGSGGLAGPPEIW